jgi:hypothetical protein
MSVMPTTASCEVERISYNQFDDWRNALSCAIRRFAATCTAQQEDAVRPESKWDTLRIAIRNADISEGGIHAS